MTTQTITTQEQLAAILATLPAEVAPQRASIICGLLGHSQIVSTCFGYVHCGRCEEQIGDFIGGASDMSKRVIIGHNCRVCRTNYEALGWQDRYEVPDPFTSERNPSTDVQTFSED